MKTILCQEYLLVGRVLEGNGIFWDWEVREGIEMWEWGWNIYNIFIFESPPMRNRNKYDWSKPFKFVSTKEEF